jgi:flavin reductase (DIM6/NTAB) family NADH-FMN oxidoreductase RutF
VTTSCPGSNRARTFASQPDHDALRRTFAAFPSGVTAVAAFVDDRPVGMAASSFISVSLDPPLVSVCISRTSQTWPLMSSAQRIGISVLAEGHTDACRQLAAKSGDRFAGLNWRRSAGDAVLLADASAWLECSVCEVLPAGDHFIVVLEVHRHGVDARIGPLVFHRSRFHRLEQRASLASMPRLKFEPNTLPDESRISSAVLAHLKGRGF